MSTKTFLSHSFVLPRQRAFTLIEVLLVLAIIGLFIICFVGFFLSRNVEPLKPPPRKPAAAKATPELPATPAPAAPEPPAPAAAPIP